MSMDGISVGVTFEGKISLRLCNGSNAIEAELPAAYAHFLAAQLTAAAKACEDHPDPKAGMSDMEGKVGP